MERIAAVVLAGGRSIRWGSEKAVAVVGGAPMIGHVAAVLSAGEALLAVNACETSGAAAWALERGLPVLPDPPGAPVGPLSGVLAGLEWARRQGVEVMVSAPCDTPNLPPDMAGRLCEALADAPAAFAVTADGPHPLCAAWPIALLPQLRKTLADGHPSARAWLAGVGARGVRFADARAFANLNTPPQVTSGPTRRI